MSKELEPLADPGLPEHVHRKADIDPIAAKRAERQVAVLFSLSAAGTLLFMYSFFFIKEDLFIFIPVVGNTNAQQLGIGLGVAFGLLFIGFGAVHWAKTLMPDQEVIAYRHTLRSEEEDRGEFVKAVKIGAEEAGLGRRPLIKRSLFAALGLAGIPAVVMLRDLGPLPGNSLNETS
ncbi:MAG: ubiquinol-cytochrome C reductase, partial [Candidatus Nanopelagicus sp.]|nr:ubiquinol-cytochrome C reductase [Candidatus Nanopelagicus sp.]